MSKYSLMALFTQLFMVQLLFESPSRSLETRRNFILFFSKERWNSKKFFEERVFILKCQFLYAKLHFQSPLIPLQVAHRVNLFISSLNDVFPFAETRISP